MYTEFLNELTSTDISVNTNKIQSNDASFTGSFFYKKNKLIIWGFLIIFILFIYWLNQNYTCLNKKKVKNTSNISNISIASSVSTNSSTPKKINAEGFKLQNSETSKNNKVIKLMDSIYKELKINITDIKSINNTIDIIEDSALNKTKIIDALEQKKKIIILHNKYIEKLKKLKTLKSSDLKDLVDSLSNKDLSLRDVKELIDNLKKISNTEYNKVVNNEISKDEILNILSYKTQLLSYYGIKHNKFGSKMLNNKGNSSNSNSNRSNSSNSSNSSTSSLFKVKKVKKSEPGSINKVTKLVVSIYKQLKVNITDEKSINKTIDTIKKSDLDINKLLDELKQKRKMIKLHNKYIKELKILKKIKTPYLKDIVKSLSNKNLLSKDVKELISNLEKISNTNYNKMVKDEMPKNEILDILSYKYKLLLYYGTKHNKFGSKSCHNKSFRYYDKINNIDLVVSVGNKNCGK